MDDNYNNQMNQLGANAGNNPPAEQPPVSQPQQAPAQPQYNQPPVGHPQQAPAQPQYNQPPVGHPQQAPAQPQYNQPPVGHPQQAPAQPPYNQPQFAGNGAVMTQAPPKKKNGVVIVGVIAAVLVIVIVAGVFLLSGSKPEKKFYGTWLVAQDFSDKVRDGMGETGKYLGDDFKFEINYVFTFKDDNTYTLSIDEASFDKAKENYIAALKKATIDYTKSAYSMYSNYSDEELTALLERGLGKSLDEYITENMSEFSYESMSKEIALNGSFKVEDDKIYLAKTISDTADFDTGGTYGVFEVKSDKEIVIKEYYIHNVADDTTFVLPATMIKQ